MPNRSYDELVTALAGTLSARQADSEAIKESLKLLCDAFPFDCGLIYEMNPQCHFQLKECCMPCGGAAVFFRRILGRLRHRG